MVNKLQFKVKMYQTLRRVELIEVDNHDEDNFNTNDTDWTKAFTLNRHYTALELIEIFKKYLENNNGSKYLIEECKSFSEENIKYEAC